MPRERGSTKLCLFCDQKAGMDYYKSKAEPEEIQGILMFFKICAAHARELDEANAEAEKREIERTVA